MSIRFKMILAVMGFLLVSGGLLLRYVFEQSVRLTGEASLATAARVFEELEDADVARLGSTLDAIERMEAVRDAFLARDRERLYAAAAPLFDRLNAEYRVTHWYFHDVDGTCFLRVHSPRLFGDRVERTTLHRAMETKAPAAGKELGKTAFALRVVHPYVIAGKLVGYLELGEEIDQYLRHMRRVTRDDYALVLAKDRLDEKAWAAIQPPGARDRWNDDPTLLVVDRTSAAVRTPVAFRPEELPREGRSLGETEVDGRTYLRGLYPVRDASGQPVGGLVVFHDTTAVHEGLLSGRIGALLGGLAALVLLLAGLVVFLNRLVFARLRRTMHVLEEVSIRLAGGDHDVGAELVPLANDEIGQFERFFSRFLVMVGAALREAETQARRAGDGR